MVHIQCVNPRDSDAEFSYCPSFGAAILFSILFGLTTVAHITQAFIYRKTFCWVIIMAGTWETAGFIFRILSVMHPTSSSYGEPSQLLILLAPLWINAFDYIVLGRMVHFFAPDQKVMGIRARRLAMWFVLLDITAFIMQIAGGLMANNNNDETTTMRGIHIYMGGIGLQECFILFFITLAVTFQRNMKRLGYATRQTDWRRLLYALYASLTLITIRIIYRLVEYSQGVYSTLTMHEAYFYCLEAVPMISALVLFNIWHPGTMLVGPESEFPKKEKKSKKEETASESSADKSSLTGYPMFTTLPDQSFTQV